MIMIYETLMLGLAALVAPLFAKFAGYELRTKPFELVGASGLFFLLTAAFALLPVEESMLLRVWSVLFSISYFIGWIALVIGAVWEMVDVLMIREAHEHS